MTTALSLRRTRDMACRSAWEACVIGVALEHIVIKNEESRRDVAAFLCTEML
jgi:hypothetical protein